MIGVLVSGGGTNLQALLDAGLPVVAVASNKAAAGALDRARAAGVATEVFELGGYPDRRARDAAMADWLEAAGRPASSSSPATCTSSPPRSSTVSPRPS